VEQLEYTNRTELKRCTIIERRWNRNAVSPGSPDNELNRRPTSLRKFRADAFSGPRISKMEDVMCHKSQTGVKGIVTDMSCCVGSG